MAKQLPVLTGVTMSEISLRVHSLELGPGFVDD